MPLVGLGVVKINGLYRLDVKGARWDLKRNIVIEHTGGGLQKAFGLQQPTGTFDEVVPRSNIYNWVSLSDFSIQLYDYETQKILVMQAEHCDWANVSGSLDQSAPRTMRNIGWTGILMPVV